MSLLFSSSSSLADSSACANNLNGGSFQQDVLVTVKDWQYVTFYRDNTTEGGSAPSRTVCLSRRRTSSQDWDTIAFKDYTQTEDDGHNTISLGFCPGDGTIHLSWDLHDTPLVYRRSTVDLTSDPERAHWSPESFTGVLDNLPGLEDLPKNKYFENVTYPRFLTLPSGSLLLEYRVGVSGLGDDLIFLYSSHPGGFRWINRGTYLKGVGCNAYINGIDVDQEGTLHVSWTWRDYVPVTLAESRQQAGPNGPENNHDLMYARSPVDVVDNGPGKDWLSSSGVVVGVAESLPIVPSSKGILALPIPKHSGILNQEAQCLDDDGGVHVLNRENVNGSQRWIHYHLPPKSTSWSKSIVPIVPPSLKSARGKVLYSPHRQALLALLPLDRELVVLEAKRSSMWGEAEGWERVGSVEGGGGNEVLFDRKRVRDGVLSMFFGRWLESDGRKVIKVIDLALA